MNGVYPCEYLLYTDEHLEWWRDRKIKICKRQKEGIERCAEFGYVCAWVSEVAKRSRKTGNSRLQRGTVGWRSGSGWKLEKGYKQAFLELCDENNSSHDMLWCFFVCWHLVSKVRLNRKHCTASKDTQNFVRFMVVYRVILFFFPSSLRSTHCTSHTDRNNKSNPW